MSGLSNFVGRFVSPTAMTAVAALLPFDFNWRNNVENLDAKIAEVQERRDALVAERESLLPTLLVDGTANAKINKLDRQIEDTERELARYGQARKISTRKVAEEEAATRAAQESGEVTALREALSTFLRAVIDLRGAETSPDFNALHKDQAGKLAAFVDRCGASAPGKPRRVAIDSAYMAWRELQSDAQKSVHATAQKFGAMQIVGNLLKKLSDGKLNEYVSRAEGATPMIVNEILWSSGLPFNRHPLHHDPKLSQDISTYMPTAHDIIYLLGPCDA